MADIDAKLEAALQEDFDKLLDTLRGALDSKRRYTVSCPRKCCNGNSFNAEFPDYRTMLEVAKWFTERVEGRSAQKPAAPEAPKTGSRLAELTDQDLEQLLGDTGPHSASIS